MVPTNDLHTVQNSSTKTLMIDEEKNDIMRAGLLSKVVDHISLLVEDWFVGMRPCTSVVPCPFCSENIASDIANFKRSFSGNPILLPSEGELRRSSAAELERQSMTQVHNNTHASNNCMHIYSTSNNFLYAVIFM